MRIRWRGLELPSRVVCAREKLSDIYGEFHVEPFERGFGHTVGNSLRRILLSSLEGSAVTKIKIQGVQHEFSSIPGMVEDITDLVLNLKLLVVKNHSEQPKTIRIERDRRGVVTAADILHDESVEIINPDHILCTLTDDVPFVGICFGHQLLAHCRYDSPATDPCNFAAEHGHVRLSTEVV